MLFRRVAVCVWKAFAAVVPVEDLFIVRHGHRHRSLCCIDRDQRSLPQSPHFPHLALGYA